MRGVKGPDPRIQSLHIECQLQDLSGIEEPVVYVAGGDAEWLKQRGVYKVPEFTAHPLVSSWDRERRRAPFSRAA